MINLLLINTPYSCSRINLQQFIYSSIATTIYYYIQSGDPMERKAKVTQDAVTDACDELMESGKNVTVNAIIAMTGGSFSTVGEMA